MSAVRVPWRQRRGAVPAALCAVLAPVVLHGLAAPVRAAEAAVPQAAAQDFRQTASVRVGGNPAGPVLAPDLRPAPDIFEASGTAVWDGKRTLQGIWVAHPLATSARRARIFNPATGLATDGAVFKLDPGRTAAPMLISAEAAQLLGVSPRQETTLRIVALSPTPPAGLPEPATGGTALAFGVVAAAEGRSTFRPADQSTGMVPTAAASNEGSSEEARKAAPADAPAPAAPSLPPDAPEARNAGSNEPRYTPPPPQVAAIRTMPRDSGISGAIRPGRASPAERPAVAPAPIALAALHITPEQFTSAAIGPAAVPGDAETAPGVAATAAFSLITTEGAAPGAGGIQDNRGLAAPRDPRRGVAGRTDDRSDGPAIATAAPGSSNAGTGTLSRAYVQAGIFGVPGNARKLIERLRAADLPASGKPVRVSGRTMTRVIAGPFQTAAARGAALETIRAMGLHDALAVAR